MGAVLQQPRVNYNAVHQPIPSPETARRFSQKKRRRERVCGGWVGAVVGLVRGRVRRVQGRAAAGSSRHGAGAAPAHAGVALGREPPSAPAGRLGQPAGAGGRGAPLRRSAPAPGGATQPFHQPWRQLTGFYSGLGEGFEALGLRAPAPGGARASTRTFHSPRTTAPFPPAPTGLTRGVARRSRCG